MNESEQWTRELLAELRATAFAPGGWRRFLARSLERARAQRAERRREHALLRALALGGVAGWAGAAAAGRPVLAAAGAAWWITCVLMVDWHLGMLRRPDRSPLPGLGVANVLSLLRAGLAPALLVLAGTTAGLVLLAAAGASDVLDGRIARRRGEVSVLGVWLDGGVDTAVLPAAALGAALAARLPWPAAALVLARFALPWLLLSVASFARAAPPRLDGLVRGRLPGLVLFTGLALAFLGAPGATPLVALGAAGGLVTLGRSTLRAYRQPAARPAQ